MTTRDHEAVDVSSGARAEAATGIGTRAQASLQTGATWQQATDAVCETLSVSEPDLAVVFVDSQFADHYEEVLRRIREATGARHLIGCSGQSVIGPGLEAEGQAAVSAMTFKLPGVSLTPLALVQDAGANDLFDSLEAADAKAWMVFADPGTRHIERLIAAVEARTAETPILGGIASAQSESDGTAVFLDDRVYPRGAVLLGIGGDIEVHALVAQGAEPIGQPWTVTDCDSNMLRTIGTRPAVDVLRETLDSLDEETRERAQRNLLLGLAMDEYRDEYGRGLSHPQHHGVRPTERGHCHQRPPAPRTDDPVPVPRRGCRGRRPQYSVEGLQGEPRFRPDRAWGCPLCLQWPRPITVRRPQSRRPSTHRCARRSTDGGAVLQRRNWACRRSDVLAWFHGQYRVPDHAHEVADSLPI